MRSVDEAGRYLSEAEAQTVNDWFGVAKLCEICQEPTGVAVLDENRWRVWSPDPSIRICGVTCRVVWDAQEADVG